MRVGQRGGRVDDPQPRPGQRVVAARRGRPVHRGRRGRRTPRASPERVAEPPVEGHGVDLLRRLPALPRPAAGGLADAGPVGRAVAGAVVARGVDEGLHQHRSAAVALLPLPRQALRRHPQRARGQVVHPHPREDQEARVAQRQVQPPPALARVPADPFVPRRQLPRRRLEQQAAEPPPLPVEDEPPQARTERARAAQRVVAVHQLVPLRPLRAAVRRRERQRLELGQAARDLRLRVRGRRVLDRARRSRCRVALRRKRQHPLRLQVLQRPQAGGHPVHARRGAPVQVLAHRQRQLPPAQRREHPHRLLDVGDLAARQPPPVKRRLLQVSDAGIHRASPQCRQCFSDRLTRPPTVVNPPHRHAPRTPTAPATQQTSPTRVQSRLVLAERQCHWSGMPDPQRTSTNEIERSAWPSRIRSLRVHAKVWRKRPRAGRMNPCREWAFGVGIGSWACGDERG